MWPSDACKYCIPPVCRPLCRPSSWAPYSVLLPDCALYFCPKATCNYAFLNQLKPWQTHLKMLILTKLRLYILYFMSCSCYNIFLFIFHCIIVQENPHKLFWKSVCAFQHWALSLLGTSWLSFPGFTSKLQGAWLRFPGWPLSSIVGLFSLGGLRRTLAFSLQILTCQ